MLGDGGNITRCVILAVLGVCFAMKIHFPKVFAILPVLALIRSKYHTVKLLPPQSEGPGKSGVCGVLKLMGTLMRTVPISAQATFECLCTCTAC